MKADLKTTVGDLKGSARIQRMPVNDFFVKYNAPIILFILIIVSSIVSENFLTWRNITTVLLQQVPYFLISMGVMLTIMTGGIDLSVAAVAGCSNVVVAILITKWGQDNVGMLFVCIALTILLGCAIGASTASYREAAHGAVYCNSCHDVVRRALPTSCQEERSSV